MQMPGFASVADLERDAETVRRHAYGMIEMRDGRLVAVRFRPWPFRITALEAAWLGRWRHEHRIGNRCRLYFNQPRSCPEFVSLTYVESTRSTTLATFRGALEVLDRIADIKRSDAIVCEAFNQRISDRLLRRWGWCQHCQHLAGRHYIKRFERPRIGAIEAELVAMQDHHQVPPV
jgi:hypothetical protein